MCCCLFLSMVFLSMSNLFRASTITLQIKLTPQTRDCFIGLNLSQYFISVSIFLNAIYVVLKIAIA